MTHVPSIFRENLVDNFFRDFDNDWFSRPFFSNKQQNLMKTDIREHEQGYELSVELPGYKKDELKLELKDGYLNISAEKQASKEEKDEKGRLIRQERYLGSMQRSFFVGQGVTDSDIKAQFENGVLKVSVPKKEKPLPEKKYIAIEG